MSITQEADNEIVGKPRRRGFQKPKAYPFRFRKISQGGGCGHTLHRALLQVLDVRGLRVGSTR
jgi:hypothetical protein